MTDSKTYTVRGAEVTVTASLYPDTVDIHLTVDLSPLDRDEPDHSAHHLVNYLVLPGYDSPQTYWWCKRQHKVTVHTGAQAQRVIKHALARIDDAVQAALIAREARKAHMAGLFS